MTGGGRNEADLARPVSCEIKAMGVENIVWS